MLNKAHQMFKERNLRDSSKSRADMDPVTMNGPTVKTSRPYKNDFVEDGIVLVDCTKTCHQLGLCRYRVVYLWCVKDVCGIICAVFTWLLVLYAEFVVMLVMLLPGPSLMYSFINAVLYNIFAFLAVAAHLRTMFTDPGAIPKGNATRENILKMGLKQGEVIFKCPKCVSIKPDRAHHCSVCQRCIRKMDHHCPWVNNCVGENNQKYFVLFTFYICLISCYSLCLAINHFIVCVGKDWKDNLQFDGLISLPDAHATHSIPLALKIFSHMIGCSSYSPPSVTIMLIILIFEGLLFGIFTAIMFGSQLSAICTDETGIEQLKKEQTSWKKKSRWLSIKAVFGHPFSLSWFSPFSAPRVGKHEDYYLHSV